MVVVLFGPYSIVGYLGYIFYQCVAVSSVPGNLKQDPTNLPTLIRTGGVYYWTVPAELVGATVDVTVVGGGGAGCAARTDGEIARAGGGGSGYVWNGQLILSGYVNFIIGSGAPCYYTDSSTGYNTQLDPGSSYDGTQSEFISINNQIKSYGGIRGKGGWYSAGRMGGDGGSGGAAAQYNAGTNGSNGGGTSSPLIGGLGQSSPLSFVDGILRAGGGGSGSNDSRTGGSAIATNGGSGGGGNGAAANGGATASNGKNGFGGGGGGAATGSGTATGGSGGSGTIILKIPIAQIKRKGKGVIII